MDPTPYETISAQKFEQIVRSVWEKANSGESVLRSGELALELARIILIIERQPNILDEHRRLAHNLGAKKMEWLRELVAHTGAGQT